MSTRTGRGALTQLAHALYDAGLYTFPRRAFAPLYILAGSLFAGIA